MKKSFSFAGVLAIILAACTAEDINVLTNNEEVNSIVAEIVQPQSSRLTIGDPIVNNGVTTFPVGWSGINPKIKGDDGDMFVAFDKNGKKAVFNYVGETGAITGNFVKYSEKDGDKVTHYFDEDFSTKDIVCAVYTGANASNLYRMRTPDDVFKKSARSYLNCTNTCMYGTIEGGSLKFRQTAGLLEINVKAPIKGFQHVFLTWGDPNTDLIGGSSKLSIEGNQATLVVKGVKEYKRNKDGSDNLNEEVTIQHNYLDCLLGVSPSDARSEAKIYFSIPEGTYPSTFTLSYTGNNQNPVYSSKKIKLTNEPTVKIEKKLYRLSKVIDLTPEPKSAKDL